MKKTVLLLALSFTLVSFLSAQNDCTGSSSTESYTVKEKHVLTGISDINNPKDCSKPAKSNIVDGYSVDGFSNLMSDNSSYVHPTKPYENYGHPVPNTQMRTGTMLKHTPKHLEFSASGSIVCCVVPSNYERYSSKNE